MYIALHRVMFVPREVCSKIAIIREVYDSDSAHETFELELERALESGVPTIVIEPTTLGDETARWIAVGNCLHKTAVLAGFGAIVSGWLYTLLICVTLLSQADAHLICWKCLISKFSCDFMVFLKEHKSKAE